MPVHHLAAEPRSFAPQSGAPESRPRAAWRARTNNQGEAYVIGPTGAPLTLADLPTPDTRRWVTRRKAEVVAAVRGGLLPFHEACARYALSPEELVSWEQLVDRYGLPGLRATRAQEYRHGPHA